MARVAVWGRLVEGEPQVPWKPWYMELNLKNLYEGAIVPAPMYGCET